MEAEKTVYVPGEETKFTVGGQTPRSILAILACRAQLAIDLKRREAKGEMGRAPKERKLYGWLFALSPTVAGSREKKTGGITENRVSGERDPDNNKKI